MQTIEFVLRSRVGSFQEGSLTGESGNTTIFLQTGDQVSLHLARHQVAGYEREGSNLIVKLADGREIVLSDYFSGDAGDQPRVFLSSNGEIVEVDLISASENEYFAQYGLLRFGENGLRTKNWCFLRKQIPLRLPLHRRSTRMKPFPCWARAHFWARDLDLVVQLSLAWPARRS